MATLNPSAMPMSKVELSVSAKNLRDKDIGSKSDPVCVLYESGHEVGRTERIENNLHPQWVTKFNLDYRFEERQVLQLHVFDWDNGKHDTKSQDKLGWVELTLAEVMANGGAPLSRKLTNGGSALISVMGEEVVDSKEVVTFTFAGTGLDKKDTFGKSDPFLIISRMAGTEAQYSAVHKTNYIKKTLDPVWPPFSLPAGRLCGGDDARALRIECFDWDSDGSHDLIGECFTNLGELRKGAQTFALINPKKKAKKKSYKDSGKLVLTSCQIHEEPTFLDFIKDGLQIHFTVAVDFTASNGDPRSPSSLHFWDPSRDNQYSAAIKAVGEIVQDYDSDKQFPALGFGGKIPPNGAVSHEFFLNGRQDTPYCNGVQGIVDAYLHSLATVALYGPTNFSPVINHVANFARSLSDGKNYFVLLILTDGVISDLANTLDSIVKASALPMSIIIVGVGNADFGAMEVLDGDGARLKSAKGVVARDIVQFVELSRYLPADGAGTAAGPLLAAAVLKEVPGQLLQYMRVRKGVQL